MSGYGAQPDCVVCRHKRISDIDAAQAAGEDDITIAQRYGVTKVSLRKHAAHKTPGYTPHPPSKTPSTPHTPSPSTPHTPPPPRPETPSNVIPLPGAFKRPREADAPVDTKAARDRLLALVATVEELIRQVVEDEEASYSDKAKLISAGQRLIESLGRFTGELTQTIDESRILASPAWKRIEGILAKALAPHPEAAAAVAEALAALEAA